jgi:hypothetical protein
MARVSASRESDSGSSILKRYPIVQSQNYILPGAPLLAFLQGAGAGTTQSTGRAKSLM